MLGDAFTRESYAATIRAGPAPESRRVRRTQPHQGISSPGTLKRGLRQACDVESYAERNATPL